METPAILNPNALATIVREEIDVSIATARRYPRELSRFRQKAMEMATADEEVAASCFYRLSRKSSGRGNKPIEGPSVRLAEIAASAYGNLRFGARIIGEDSGSVIAQGVAHDLETNVAFTSESRRGIVTKEGERFSRDMVTVTQNAACAIAFRNAVFKAIPFVFIKPIYEAAKKVAVGDAKTMPERRHAWVDWFSKVGVTLDQLLTYFEKKALEEVGLLEIEEMIGMSNSIKDGETTVEEMFAAKNSAEMPKRASEVKAAENAPQEEVKPAQEPEPAKAEESVAAAGLPEVPLPEGQPMKAEPSEERREFTDSVARTKFHDNGNIGIQTNKNGWINTRNRDLGKFAEARQATGKKIQFTLLIESAGQKLIALVEAEAV